MINSSVAMERLKRIRVNIFSCSFKESDMKAVIFICVSPRLRPVQLSISEVNTRSQTEFFEVEIFRNSESKLLNLEGVLI